jgi:SAM-dependent methyltransferase
VTPLLCHNRRVACPLCSSKQTTCIFRKTNLPENFHDYYACRNCHLTFLDPSHRLSPEEEKKRYDLHENDPEDEQYVSFLSRLTTPLLPFLKPGFTGLDFGCGPGPAVSHVLGQSGFKVYNYDPFYFPNQKLLDTQYDFITATEVIEHVPSPQKTFEQLDTLLKPTGSYLAIMTQILEPEIDFKKWWYHKEETHICFYQKRTFVWLSGQMKWDVQFPTQNVVIFCKGKWTD